MNRVSGTRLSWLICVLLFGYTAFLYLGLGPVPSSGSVAAWAPSGFLRDSGLAEPLRDQPLLAVALAAAIPAAGCLVHLLFAHSAIAFAWVCSCLVTSSILAFYGLTGAIRVWSFFGWRGSVVIACSGVLVGVALAAPMLAAKWLRLSTATRWLVYGPIAFAITALIRNVTGTDERLPFNLSPWPAIDVLGLEIAVYALVGLLIGGASGAVLVARLGDRPAGRFASLALAGLAPVLWFFARFDHTAAGLLLVGWTIATGIVVVTVRFGHPSQRELERRAGVLVVAAGLVVFPVMAGSSLAEGDHAVSRHVRARSIIDALSRHYDDHDEYPEDLAALVAERRLERIPTPRVGFELFSALGWSETPAFRYQNLGSSYLLEFASTEWVMCSYSPGWREIDDDEEPEEEEVPTREEVAHQTAQCFAECGRVCLQDCDPETVTDCDARCSRACEEECASASGFDDDAPDPSREAWACPAGRPELW